MRIIVAPAVIGACAIAHRCEKNKGALLYYGRSSGHFLMNFEELKALETIGSLAQITT